ncbi:hypothetical protein V6N11_082937 [Hibiscus sabdariffa]|uniref:Uncharacterized protein n=1 Tax=Hibiscus sabdariffa TaxID=183260 RepID=A0ABR2QKZ3_9ROSI
MELCTTGLEEYGGGVEWRSQNLESPVWQRSILIGEKCKIPRFSGLILYDERGQLLDEDVYLGIPLGAKRNSVRLWDPILSKFSHKMSGWKAISLSFGGRITLVKHVLSSFPVCFLSLFKMPVSIYKKLNSIMARFLWGGLTDKKKVHWLNWSDVCRPIHLGGLGISDHCIKNRALLGKWFWHFGNEQDNVWKRMISSK